MASFSRNTKTNTRLPIWDTTGGENHQFFCANCLLTKPAVCGIIKVGVQRAGNDSGGPIFRSLPPYAKFLRLLATFHMRQIFPEKCRGPIGSPYVLLISPKGRSVHNFPQRAPAF
jgi:hypothetical protein